MKLWSARPVQSGRTQRVPEWQGPRARARLGARERKRLEPPDHEGARPARLLDELEVRPEPPQRLHAGLELDAGERRADADVDPAAEADVLGRVLPAGVELVRPVEDTRVAVRGAEEQRDLRAARNRRLADREVVRQDPALEELERRIEADHLLDRGSRWDGIAD